MDLPEPKEWIIFFSMISNIALFIAIMQMDANSIDYKSYKECIKYTEKQTCFEKTLKRKEK